MTDPVDISTLPDIKSLDVCQCGRITRYKVTHDRLPYIVQMLCDKCMIVAFDLGWTVTPL